MGLTATAAGLDAETCFDCGYFTYANFIFEVVRVAYGDYMLELFKKTALFGKKCSEEESKYWNTHCNDDLDLLIWHSDCDGKFTPKECRLIYNAMKDLHSDMQGHNYGVMKYYNMFDHWRYMFKHCADRRVNLWYR